MEEPRIGLRGLIEHLTCLEDESTCPDIMACPLLAEESLPERRVAALQAWEQEQAAWEVIRQEIESEDRARVREAAKEGIKLVDLGTETKDSIPMVVEDLVPEGQIILLCGEEGTGKSWWIYQLAGEMCAGGLAFGEFVIPEPVKSVLIVDVEQTEEDVQIIRDEMVARGTIQANAEIYWLGAAGRAFDQKEDREWLVRQIALYEPELLMIDTVTDSVTSPTDDKSANPLMKLLHSLLSETNTRAVIGTAQPRKQGQAADAKGRSFDSLFGSRVWKSKSSAVFFITEDKLTVWKQRGRYLEKRWGRVGGSRYAWGRLIRQAEGPPTIVCASEQTLAEMMVAVSAFLQEHAEPVSQNAVEEGVRGNRARVRAALDELVTRQYVERTRGANRSKLHRLIRPFEGLAVVDF